MEHVIGITIFLTVVAVYEIARRKRNNREAIDNRLIKINPPQKRKKELTQSDLFESWDVSNVTNMSELFKNCTAFNQDISGWDVNYLNKKQ